MVANAFNPQTTPAPEPSAAPRILVVDDAFFKALGMCSALRGAGYIADMASTPQDAAQKLQQSKFDLVIVDGDLGDNRWDASSASARFIREHLTAIPFGRYSGKPEAIPPELRGSFCFGEVQHVTAWVSANLPIGPAMPISMPRPGIERQTAPAPSRVRSFPDVGALDTSGELPDSAKEK